MIDVRFVIAHSSRNWSLSISWAGMERGELRRGATCLGYHTLQDV